MLLDDANSIQKGPRRGLNQEPPCCEAPVLTTTAPCSPLSFKKTKTVNLLEHKQKGKDDDDSVGCAFFLLFLQYLQQWLYRYYYATVPLNWCINRFANCWIIDLKTMVIILKQDSNNARIVVKVILMLIYFTGSTYQKMSLKIFLLKRHKILHLILVMPLWKAIIML